MQVGIFSVFLLVSSSLLFSTVVCDPNHHHHNHNNDFPWQSILSSLGIAVENQTGVISNIEQNGGAPLGNKEHYTSEPTVEVQKSETKDGTEIPTVVQNGTNVEIVSRSSSSGGLGYKIGIPIVSIVFFVLFWYCVCKCCCACCQRETPGVVVMQSNTVQNQQPAAPQIILQQPIIHQQAPPTYDAQQKWAHAPPQGPPQWNQPPPQGYPQWNQPPQGPPQFAPHPMSEQQQYSPNSAYDNPGFNPAMAPPPYNTGKY
ncbi:unnamed protein product [Larinioides sclopetarius]|uniref:Uncharacterized protein n=1 Tax=Larinioides sclopetarius TaxID=280406 RepID=A0AAV2B1A1_9ARAC